MKLTKENVYVKVTTLEESQDLLKVLTESGESVIGNTKEGLRTGIDNDGDSQFNYPFICTNGNRWFGLAVADKSKTQVSIPQLKEILNPMTLEKALAELESLKDKIEGLIKKEYNIERLKKSSWQKDKSYPLYLMYFDFENKKRYGFDLNGKWVEDDNVNCYNDGNRIAIREEIEQSLIKEARKRYNVGDNISRSQKMLNINKTENASRIEVISKSCFDKMYYCSERNGLYTSQGCVILIQGEWAEVIDTTRTKLDTDIQALKEKYKDFKITVIVE